MGYEKKVYSEEEKTMYFMIKNAETIEKYQELGWPDLRGSVKQLAWAMNIKMAAVQDFKDIVNKEYFKLRLEGSEEFYKTFEHKDVEDIKDYFVTNFIMKCNDCSWLIKNRNIRPKFLIVQFNYDSWEEGIIKRID